MTSASAPANGEIRTTGAGGEVRPDERSEIEDLVIIPFFTRPISVREGEYESARG